MKLLITWLMYWCEGLLKVSPDCHLKGISWAEVLAGVHGLLIWAY